MKGRYSRQRGHGNKSSREVEEACVPRSTRVWQVLEYKVQGRGGEARSWRSREGRLLRSLSVRELELGLGIESQGKT